MAPKPQDGVVALPKEKPVTRYWLLLLASAIVRVIIFSEPTREYAEACKKELWELENI